MGGQVERGEHHVSSVIPTGVRFVDNNGQPFQAISSDPSNVGGLFITAAAFASDAITMGDRLTINAGRAVRPQPRHQSGPARARSRRARNRRDRPRPGHAVHLERVVAAPGRHAKLSADGRTMLRASYGRFSQGVLTGEFAAIPPRRDPDHDGRVRSGDRRLHDASSRWSIPESTCSSIPRRARRARTSTPLAWIARSVAGWRWRSPTSARTARNFIGWTDVGGQYREETRTLARRPQRAGVRARQRPGRSPLSVDESRRILADVQRPRDGRRKAPVRTAGRRLAPIRCRGRRAAGLQRDDRRGRAGQHGRRRAPS